MYNSPASMLSYNYNALKLGTTQMSDTTDDYLSPSGGNIRLNVIWSEVSAIFAISLCILCTVTSRRRNKVVGCLLKSL